jgi:hypothetical protein
MLSVLKVAKAEKESVVPLTVITTVGLTCAFDIVEEVEIAGA